MAIAASLGHSISIENFKLNGQGPVRDIAQVVIDVTNPNVIVSVSVPYGELPEEQKYGLSDRLGVKEGEEDKLKYVPVTIQTFVLNGGTAGSADIIYRDGHETKFASVDKNGGLIEYTYLQDGQLIKIFRKDVAGFGKESKNEFEANEFDSSGKVLGYEQTQGSGGTIEIDPSGRVSIDFKETHWYGVFYLGSWGHERVNSVIDIDEQTGQQNLVSSYSETNAAMLAINNWTSLYLNPVGWYAAVVKGTRSDTLYILQRSDGWKIAMAAGQIVTDIALLYFTAGIGSGIMTGGKTLAEGALYMVKSASGFMKYARALEVPFRFIKIGGEILGRGIGAPLRLAGNVVKGAVSYANTAFSAGFKGSAPAKAFAKLTLGDKALYYFGQALAQIGRAH